MIWILFLLLIAGLLALDLGVFHKDPRVISMKESLLWTLFWIVLALLFGGGLYYLYKFNLFNINPDNNLPSDSMLTYITGYVIEKSLSLDNIFVIAMIFSFFRIESRFQHNILFWGIIGAIIFRGIMIFLGASFIKKFHWSTYLFGIILIYSAIRMMTARHDNVDYYKNPVLRFISKIYPIQWENRSSKYFIRDKGRLLITVSFATLVVIEFTDVLFALDSIPAILAITTDSFIVFTSNIFAILGLRSLYFFIASMMDRFRYMKFSLVFILMFVGVKMILVNHYKFPTWVSLCFILGALFIGIVTSLMSGEKDTAKLNKPL
jgi:tellurite resistance protein TerC